MNEPTERQVPVLLWPFYAIWRLLTFILGVVGRLLCALIGIVVSVQMHIDYFDGTDCFGLHD